MERISHKCWQLILGSLLGDSWLSKTKKGRRKNSYMGVCHSEKQVNYLNHKFEILKEIGVSKIYNKSYLRENKKIKSQEFVTKSLPQLTKLRKELYPKNKKKITKKYLDKLDNIGLAYWIMDDGSLSWHKRNRKNGKIYSTCEFYLAVNCFNLNEIEIIKEWFIENYKVNPKVRYHSSSKSFYIIFNRLDYQKIAKLINPYILPSMKYKTDFSKLGKLVEKNMAPN